VAYSPRGPSLVKMGVDVHSIRHGSVAVPKGILLGRVERLGAAVLGGE
jgi:hypothetical protein